MKHDISRAISRLSVALATVIIFWRCGSSESETPTPTPTPPPTSQIPIRLNVGMTTRATDASFEQGDRIGLYVVNYSASQQPGTLQNSGNHADNYLFTYNNTWTTATPLYWKDADTHADFYVYYPYQPTVSSVTAMPFSVSTDQRTAAQQTASDLMWGKTSNQSPSEQSVNVQLRHLMSSAVVKVVAGDGFTDEELQQANPVVSINDVKCQMHANLSNGTLTLEGAATSVTPGKVGDEWRAILPPQKVESTRFISVHIGDREYAMNKQFTFEGGRRHSFTVTVNRTSAGLNVGITQWDTDDVDHGGVAE